MLKVKQGRPFQQENDIPKKNHNTPFYGKGRKGFLAAVNVSCSKHLYSPDH